MHRTGRVVVQDTTGWERHPEFHVMAISSGAPYSTPVDIDRSDGPVAVAIDDALHVFYRGTDGTIRYRRTCP